MHVVRLTIHIIAPEDSNLVTKYLWIVWSKHVCM